MADSKNRKEVCCYIPASLEKSVLSDSKKFKLSVSRIIEAHILKSMTSGKKTWDPRITLIRFDDANPTSHFDKKANAYIAPNVYEFVSKNCKKYKMPKSKFLAAVVIKNLQTKSMKSWDPRYILLGYSSDPK